MAVPLSLQGWADVEGEGDFITYLGLLADDVRDPAAGRWASTHARTAPAQQAPIGRAVVEDPEQVVSAAGLAGWLRHRAEDCRRDDEVTRQAHAAGSWVEGTWAHGTELAGYLEAWHACLHDHRAGKRRLRFRARTWAEVADALLDGTYYE